MQSIPINITLLQNNTGQIDGIKNNPRTIDASSYAKLKQSITDYPDMLHLRELLVIPHGDNYVVIAGNQRLRALKELGYKEAYCKILHKDTSHDFINAVIIKDNVDLGSWDYDMLANEWEEMELIEWGVDLPDSWDVEDIDEKYQANEEDVPDISIKEPVTKRGDVWLCGKHRVMCGDSTMIDDVEKLMNGKKADMVFTDPPYRMEANGGGFDGFSTTMKSIKHLCDFDPIGLLNILPTIFDKNMNTYIFCNKDLVPDYLNWGVDNGYSFNILVWKKNGGMCLGGTHRPDLEYLLHFRKNAIFNNGLKNVDYSKCLEYDRFSHQKKISEAGGHPTPKPIELITNEILISSNKDNNVVDLFGGSGSTLIACEKTQRINYSMELDPKYVDVIVKRWQNFTGKTATLEGINKTFNELEVANGVHSS